MLTPFQARTLMWKWWQLIWRQNNWKNRWFIGTYSYFSLCPFFDGTTRFSNKIWVPKRPHKSILAKGIQIIPKQRIFVIRVQAIFQWLKFLIYYMPEISGMFIFHILDNTTKIQATFFVSANNCHSWETRRYGGVIILAYIMIPYRRNRLHSKKYHGLHPFFKDCIVLLDLGLVECHVQDSLTSY